MDDRTGAGSAMYDTKGRKKMLFLQVTFFRDSLKEM